MTLDFTGRTAPYGGKELEDSLIGDRDLWVFCAYIPYSAYEIGRQTVSNTYWCDIKLEWITETREMPMYGHCSWYDFTWNDTDNDQLAGG